MAVAAESELITPPPKTMIPKAAPKAAPWDTPNVEADASGFCSTHCMTAPATARVAPTSTAAITRGSLMFITMVRVWGSPLPSRVLIIAARGTSREPALMAKKAITMVMANDMTRT